MSYNKSIDDSSMKDIELQAQSITLSTEDQRLNEDEVVTLDVGGLLFKTTKFTLTKYRNTFFTGLFKMNSPLRQKDGSIFIDRDGKHFRLLLNFMRSGRIMMPEDHTERKEVMVEAEYYCLDDFIMDAWDKEKQLDKDGSNSHCIWESNMIFIGYKNIDFEQYTEDGDLIEILKTTQCPDSTEHVWKSIHDSGLTVIFQICPPSSSQNTDFSLNNIRDLLKKLKSWNRNNLRFVLVYDAELIRELLKISGEKFNNSSYVWYFSKGKLIECVVQWKLRYVAENVWKHYYLSIDQIG